MSDPAADIARFAADLDRSNRGLLPRVRKVTQEACAEVRDVARELARGLRHAPHYPRAITYSTDYVRGGVVGEVGPDKDLKQGALGNILEFGTAKNPPHPHLHPAFERAVPGWMDKLGEAATEGL